jgi:hypothetical protein
MKVNTSKKANTVTKSLNVKKGCIANLSTLPVTPFGLFEPCVCKLKK